MRNRITPRGPLFEEGYRPRFTGHQKFPPRHGWLRKAFDAVAATENGTGNKDAFPADDAIARFGVGRNMVASMRHWATAAGIIAESSDRNRVATTAFGREIFGPDGLDPHMEYPATLWLVHWNLVSRPAKTTWFFAFNHLPASIFDLDILVESLLQIAEDRGWERASETTIRSDAACFIQTHAARPPNKRADNDGAFESPLAELGLIAPAEERGAHRLIRGAKPTLGDGVFLRALTDFWKRRSPDTATLPLEAVAFEPGSPGRAFLLDENNVADQLVGLEESTDGALQWSETSGVKQIVRRFPIDSAANWLHIRRDFEATTRKRAA